MNLRRVKIPCKTVKAIINWFYFWFLDMSKKCFFFFISLKCVCNLLLALPQFNSRVVFVSLFIDGAFMFTAAALALAFYRRDPFFFYQPAISRGSEICWKLICRAILFNRMQEFYLALKTHLALNNKRLKSSKRCCKDSYLFSHFRCRYRSREGAQVGAAEAL